MHVLPVARKIDSNSYSMGNSQANRLAFRRFAWQPVRRLGGIVNSVCLSLVVSYLECLMELRPNRKACLLSQCFPRFRHKLQQPETHCKLQPKYTAWSQDIHMARNCSRTRARFLAVGACPSVFQEVQTIFGFKKLNWPAICSAKNIDCKELLFFYADVWQLNVVASSSPCEFSASASAAHPSYAPPHFSSCSSSFP